MFGVRSKKEKVQLTPLSIFLPTVQMVIEEETLFGVKMGDEGDEGGYSRSASEQ